MATIKTIIDINPDECLLFCCDIQQIFLKHIFNMDSILYNAQVMNKVSSVFKIPIIATEMAPEKLGKMVPEIKKNLPKDALVFAKTKFSMFTEELQNVMKEKFSERKTIILYGIESHIPVIQTAFDALKKGYNLIVIANGISSQTNFDRLVTIKQLHSLGVRLVSTESLVFE